MAHLLRHTTGGAGPTPSEAIKAADLLAQHYGSQRAPYPCTALTVCVVALCAHEHLFPSDTSLKAEVTGGIAARGWSAARTGTDVPTKDAQSAALPG